jgi:CMP-N,N'-diacetyllegionaminic acid synthase
MSLGYFENLINGKTVAVVGNSPVDKDYSEEIDAHDIVIRFNHFYNYDSCLVGKKVNVIFATPTGPWAMMSPEERHWDIIQEQKPDVFILKHEKRVDNTIINNHYRGCKIMGFTEDFVEDEGKYTTGTCGLKILTKCYNFSCDVYGFSSDEDWKHYIDTDASHYSKTYIAEAIKREYYIKKLNDKKIFQNDTIKPEVHPVITVRAGSSVKDKNIREYHGKPLLQIAIEKALNVFGKVTVLVDSQKYADLATKWGGTVPYIDKPVSGDENVAIRLRRWRDMCNIEGRIILMSATSPNTSEDTIRKAVEMSEGKSYREVVGTTKVYDEVKHSALMYQLDNGYMVQALKAVPDISVPRQHLLPLYLYNGAVTTFMHTQLDYDKLFTYTFFIPLMIPKEEGLDIDRDEDFTK